MVPGAPKPWHVGSKAPRMAGVNHEQVSLPTANSRQTQKPLEFVMGKDVGALENVCFPLAKVVQIAGECNPTQMRVPSTNIWISHHPGENDARLLDFSR